METANKKSLGLKVLTGFILVFGLMTIAEGGRTLFTEVGSANAGNVVPFVLWFNFIAGFFYIIAGVAIYKQHACAKRVPVVLAAGSLIVLTLLGFHIFEGKPYEVKTAVAMSFRTIVWVSIAIATFKSQLLNVQSCEC